jgi:hypothetical protein
MADDTTGADTAAETFEGAEGAEGVENDAAGDQAAAQETAPVAEPEVEAPFVNDAEVQPEATPTVENTDEPAAEEPAAPLTEHDLGWTAQHANR